MSEEWTRAQCAEEWSIEPDTWSGYVSRGQAPKAVRHVGRTPVWDADQVRGWERPGPGARMDLRPRCDGCHRPMNSGEKVYETMQGEVICAGCCREATTRKIAASWELP